MIVKTIKNIGLACLVFFLLACSAHAQISPGKLSRFHSELEGIKNCTQCHQLGEREIDETKCFSCHTALAERVEAGFGYHVSSEVKGSNCAKCHSEHHGREYELVYWENGTEKFDHGLTGYQLQGKHREQEECNSCHRRSFIHDFRADDTINLERTYLGLNSSCINCHQDEHAGQLDKECLTCHSYQSWVPAEGFNHSETDYPLTGKHNDVECNLCHKLEKSPSLPFEGVLVDSRSPDHYSIFSGLKFNECSACHKDPHEGSFGEVCSKCHTTQSFTQILGGGFDHSLTGYPLLGQHAKVQCNQCHTSGDMKAPLKHDNCTDCHNDTHRGQLTDSIKGNECHLCHSFEGFIPSNYSVADHEDCDFPLTGRHQAVPCFLCHKQAMDEQGESYTQFTFENKRCQVCHEDVHKGQLNTWINKGGCEFCHTAETWNATSFDHSLSRFPLEGKHREIDCLQCHTLRIGTEVETVWQKPDVMECFSCHSDIHYGQFGKLVDRKQVTECKTCHISFGWSQLTFDHDTDTQFPLTGGHENVVCTACHNVEYAEDGNSFLRYRPTPLTCAECHGGR